jgi:hypothetical protein
MSSTWRSSAVVLFAVAASMVASFAWQPYLRSAPERIELTLAELGARYVEELRRLSTRAA